MALRLRQERLIIKVLITAMGLASAQQHYAFTRAPREKNKKAHIGDRRTVDAKNHILEGWPYARFHIF